MSTDLRPIALHLLHAVGIFALLLATVPAGAAPEAGAAEAEAPKVFLDCDEDCSLSFIRTEIPFVDYVRDRAQADVHVLITTQTTGAAGREYTLAFLGLGRFDGLKQTLRYASQKNEPDERVQSGLVRTLKAGLVPYLVQTPLLARIEVSLAHGEAVQGAHDPWNFWVFTLDGKGEVNGERSERTLSASATLGADRVTDAWKLSFALTGQHDESRFDTDEEGLIRSTKQQSEARGLVVKSLGRHWSAGAKASAFSSTFNNTDLSLTLSPALEYDVFPYGQSTRRELRLLYSLNLKRTRYKEETLYGKLHETLPGESLSVTLNQKEPWGTLEGRLEAAHDFRDLHKYRLDLSGEAKLRLTEGLSLELDGSVSRIRDQLSIPRRDATVEEVLLRQRELASNYQYKVEVGLTYTFGSIFNNVVNPRFGE